VSFDDPDAIRVHQAPYAVGDRLYHGALPRHQLGVIDARALDGYAELPGNDVAKQLGIAHHRLGRNTAPVEAGATQGILFHQSDPTAKLRPADGGHVTARSTADDHHIVGMLPIHRMAYFGRSTHRLAVSLLVSFCTRRPHQALTPEAARPQPGTCR